MSATAPGPRNLTLGKRVVITDEAIDTEICRGFVTEAALSYFRVQTDGGRDRAFDYTEEEGTVRPANQPHTYGVRYEA